MAATRRMRIDGPNAEAQPVVLSQRALAAPLGISERKLEDDRRQGTGIPFVKFGRRILYRREDVVRHLEQLVVPSTAEAKARNPR